MNFLELARRVKQESGGLSGGGPASFASATGDDARVFGWVNSGWRDLDLMKELWSWRQGVAQATTSGSMTLPPAAVAPGFGITDFASWRQPTRDYRPTAYKVSEGQQSERPLYFLPFDRFRRLFMVGVHQPGPLQYWSISTSGDFLVGPTPDAAHIVRSDYVKTNTPMTADTQVPAMPERFHEIIVWHALRQYGGFDAASEVWQRADFNYRSLWPDLALACLPRPQFAARPLA